MNRFPTEITIREVGPREGLQTQKEPIKVVELLSLVSLLSTTGVQEIEVASLIKNGRVPAMGIADEVLAGLTRDAKVRFTALYLNDKGYLRGQQIPAIKNGGWLSTAASDTFLLKNANTNFAETLKRIPISVALYKKEGTPLEGIMFSTAFGCAYEGAVSPRAVAEKIQEIKNALSQVDETLPRVFLADTAGLGSPKSVKDVIDAVKRAVPEISLALHLHDTRGLGIANAYAGLEMGISFFDASVGGVGGCPFVRGAAGNIATEELIYLSDSLGIKSGISLDRYLDAAQFAQTLFKDNGGSKLLRTKKL